MLLPKICLNFLLFPNVIKSKVYFPFGLTFLEGCLENLTLKPKFNLKLIISIFPTPPPASQIAFTEISHKIKLYDNLISFLVMLIQEILNLVTILELV